MRLQTSTYLPFVAAALALLAGGCAKFAESPAADAAVEETTLWVSGKVLNTSSAPVPEIEVVLKCFSLSDDLQENVLASETTFTGTDGSFQIRKHLNQPVYTLKHILHFTDLDKEENGGYYKHKTHEILAPKDGLSATPRGYIFKDISIFLDKYE